MPLEIEQPVFDDKGAWLPDERGEMIDFNQDECIRAGTNFEALMNLNPIPGVVSYGGAGWTPLLRFGGMAMTAVLAASASLCLFELWLAGPLRRWRHQPDPSAPNPMLPKLREKDSAS